jgi:uncharacterized protein YidB (DUF937 family)
MFEDLLAGAVSGGAWGKRRRAPVARVLSAALERWLRCCRSCWQCSRIAAVHAGHRRAAEDSAISSARCSAQDALAVHRAAEDSQISSVRCSAGEASGAGGLGGLLEKLNQGGYAQPRSRGSARDRTCRSSKGAIRDVFGQHGLAAIAQQAGLSEDKTSEGLAQLLPDIVNHVTPQGRVPQGGELDSTLEGLLRQVAR